MLGKPSTLHVFHEGRTVLCNDSSGRDCKKNGNKTVTRRNRRKTSETEHPFLPEELTDRIVEFAKSFGLKIIVISKVGKLIRSNKPVREMSAYCCVYYIDNSLLQVGLVRYNKGKISIISKECCGHEKWISTFELAYNQLAEEVKYAVLQGSVDPLVVPGLFLIK